MVPEWWDCVVFPYMGQDDAYARFLVEYHHCQHGTSRWAGQLMLKIVRSLDKNPRNPNRRRNRNG